MYENDSVFRNKFEDTKEFEARKEVNTVYEISKGDLVKVKEFAERPAYWCNDGSMDYLK